MTRIFCFGEALVDMLQVGSDQEGPLSIPRFRQFPGGAPANVAVAVGKLGGQASFIGQVGDDTFGRFLKQSLKSYGVDTVHLNVHNSARTPIAFVSLDDFGERSFEFYRHDTADLAYRSDQLPNGALRPDDIFHFCSNTLTHESNYRTTLELLERAKSAGCLISFDLNVRENLWPNPALMAPRISASIGHADIVKLSLEELDYIEPHGLGTFVELATDVGVSLILATDGANPVSLYAAGANRTVKTPKVDAVDTTAAGDAFIGGFLHLLARAKSKRDMLGDPDSLVVAVDFAVSCGAHTVARAGAYTALPEAKDIC